MSPNEPLTCYGCGGGIAAEYGVQRFRGTHAGWRGASYHNQCAPKEATVIKKLLDSGVLESCPYIPIRWTCTETDVNSDPCKGEAFRDGKCLGCWDLHVLCEAHDSALPRE